MVKNYHFCTEELLKQIYTGELGSIIETYRTGFVPTIYSGDKINLTEKMLVKPDKFIRKGRVEWVLPLQYIEIKKSPIHRKALVELKRYKRKFHDKHWFFIIGIKLF
jgi:hypothetical protein